jgi:predicted nuclease of predicted toxin-antitoxin system
MKVVLDEGLAVSAAELLRREGYDAIHARECGLARAKDADILA